jgi:hypothetical protein
MIYIYILKKGKNGFDSHNAQIELSDGSKGTVSVGINYEFVDFNLRGMDDGLHISFEGTNCLRCCWVQFFSQSAGTLDLSVDPPKYSAIENNVVEHPLHGKIKFSGKKDHWYLDHIEGDNACYSSVGTAERTNKKITIYDRPSNWASILRKKDGKLNKNDAVWSGIEFVSYLVCSGKVEYRVEWKNYSSSFPKAGKNVWDELYGNRFVDGKKVNKMDPEHSKLVQ